MLSGPRTFPLASFMRLLSQTSLEKFLDIVQSLEPLFPMVHLSSRAFDIFGLCIGILYGGEWGHCM